MTTQTKNSDQSKSIKRYIITGYFCGKLTCKVVMQLDAISAITRFCAEQSIDESDIVSVVLVTNNLH
jgi:hypothetical protein